MQQRSLGEFIRELREKADLSLREVARQVDISPAFLSDVEWGRRYPSDDTFEKLAKALKVQPDELKAFDHRDSVSDLKRLIENNPSLGFAFRSAVNEMKEGKLTAGELERRVKGLGKNSK